MDVKVVDTKYQKISKSELNSIKRHFNMSFIVSSSEEWVAMNQYMRPVPGYEKIFEYKHVDDTSFGSIYLGLFGKYLVSYAQCAQGSSSPGGARSTAQNIIKAVGTKAILTIGMLGGLKNTSEYPVGKVLISKRMVNWSLIANKEMEIGRRGIIESNPRLCAAFESYIRDYNDSADGKIINSEMVLTASADRLERAGLKHQSITNLILQNPEVKGIEMEGHGIYTALHESRSVKSTDFLVIKGISDYCESASEDDKLIACSNAAKLCFNVFDNPDAFEEFDVTSVNNKILLSIQNCVSRNFECKIVPSIETMRKPTRFYLGRGSEDKYLKNSLLDNTNIVTAFIGARGSGKSEIVRQSLINPNSKKLSWIQKNFNTVYILDFSVTRVRYSWIDYLFESVNIAGNQEEGIINNVNILINEIRARNKERFLIVFENCEEISVGSDDESISRNFNDLVEFVDMSLDKEINNLEILILSTDKKILDEINDGYNEFIDVREVNSLSFEESCLLLRNWEEANDKNGITPGDRRIRNCFDGNTVRMPNRTLERLVGLTNNLPRLLRTLHGVLVQDGRNKERKTLNQILLDIETIGSGFGADNLSVLLNHLFDNLDDRQRAIVILLSAVRVSVSLKEIRTLLEILAKYLGSSAFDKRGIDYDIEYLSSVNIIGRTSSKKWELPNQILDFITISILDFLPESEKISYYRSARDILTSRCGNFIEDGGINASEEQINVGSGMIEGYRYEDIDYRENLSERIRCYGFINESESRIITLAEFFEMMSWWGETDDFKAIHVLISAWEQSLAHRNNPGFLLAIKQFYTDYVKEPERENGEDHSDRWESVLSSLRKLREIFDEDRLSLTQIEQMQIQDRIWYVESAFHIYEADALSNLGLENYDMAISKYEKGIFFLNKVQKDNFDIAYNRISLFNHHAKYGFWERAYESLRPTFLKKGRDVNDREVEAKILYAISRYYFYFKDYEKSIMASLYSCMQCYIFLLTQEYIADSYSLIVYKYITKGITERLIFCKEKLNISDEEVIERIGKFWNDEFLNKIDSVYENRDIKNPVILFLNRLINNEDKVFADIEMRENYINLYPQIEKILHGNKNEDKISIEKSVAIIDENIDNQIAVLGGLMKEKIK